MIKLNQPKFKFYIYVQSKHKYKENAVNTDKVVCYADTYEISPDGTITFYQVGSTSDNKKIKIPVLSYPDGKWETCVLADDLDQLPAFQFKSQSVTTQIGQASYPRTTKPIVENESAVLPDTNPIREENNEAPSNNGVSLLDELDGFLSSDSSPSKPMSSSYSAGLPSLDNSNVTPGVTEHNPEEYKKKKNDFLETRIKEYIKYEDNFVISKFLPSVQNEARIKDIGNISETDVIWAASNLIRAKSVIARKFSSTNMQKVLAITLPDIMKRQWNGKMSPILQVLQDREETKNATAIDLSVWMANNGFTD